MSAAKKSLDKNAVIVFISDNGGSSLTGANNAPLTGGKYSFWEVGIRVPLAIVYPDKIEKGQTITDYISAADISPTLTNIAKVQVNASDLDGVDLLNPVKDRLLVWKWQKNLGSETR